MVEVFGDFIEMGDSQEFLIISFSPTTIPIQERWRGNSLSADFLADYWGTFFPIQSSSSPHKQAEVKDAVSYIANELLENAIKFTYEASGYPMNICLYLSEGSLRFYMTNSIDPQAVGKFQNLIRKLLTEDPDELYIRQLEINATSDSGDSGLGFLMMINDYGARLAWKFESIQQNPDIITVTTMVQLAIVRSHVSEALGTSDASE